MIPSPALTYLSSPDSYSSHLPLSALTYLLQVHSPLTNPHQAHSGKDLVDLAHIAGFLISLLLQQQVAPHSHEQYIATKLGCV